MKEIPKIQVLLVRVQKEPELVDVEASVEGFRKLLGGSDVGPHLEWVELDDGSCIICDEDGKMKKLPANRWMHRHRIEELLVGDFFVCNIESGKEEALTDEQLFRWQRKFALAQSGAS